MGRRGERRRPLRRVALRDRCSIDNHPIDSDDEVEFDHIHPYWRMVTAVDNIPALLVNATIERNATSRSASTAIGSRCANSSKGQESVDSTIYYGTNSRNGFGIGELRREGKRRGHVLRRWRGAVRVAYVSRDPRKVFSRFRSPARVVRTTSSFQPRLEPERVWELYRHLRRHTQKPASGRAARRRFTSSTLMARADKAALRCGSNRARRGV